MHQLMAAPQRCCLHPHHRPRAFEGQAQVGEPRDWRGPGKVLAQPPALTALCLPSTPTLWLQGDRGAERGPSPMPDALMPPREQGPASHRSAPVRPSLGGALGKKMRGTAKIPSHLPSQCTLGHLPLPRPLHHPHLPPRPHSPSTPSWVSRPSSQWSLVREPACLFSSQWCCSAVPMATALGVLPPPRELPRTCPCPLPASAGSRTGRERGRRQGWEGGTGRLRMPGLCGRNRPLRVILGPAGGPEASPGCSEPHPWGGEAASPRLERGPAYSRAWLSCVWCQLALPSCWASWRPPSTATQGQGLPAKPTAAPPQLSSGPAPLPSPNCGSSCRRQLSPHLHSKRSPPTVLPRATANCQPFLPEPTPATHVLGPGLCFPDLPSRTQAGPHLPCAWAGAGVRGQGQKAGEGGGGLADRGGGEGAGQNHCPWCQLHDQASTRRDGSQGLAWAGPRGCGVELGPVL